MEKSFAEAVENKTAPIVIDVDGINVELGEDVMNNVKAFAEELEVDFEAVEEFYDQLQNNPVILVRKLFGGSWAGIKDCIRDENGKVPHARVGNLLRSALEAAGLKN